VLLQSTMVNKSVPSYTVIYQEINQGDGLAVKICAQAVRTKMDACLSATVNSYFIPVVLSQQKSYICRDPHFTHI